MTHWEGIPATPAWFHLGTDPSPLLRMTTWEIPANDRRNDGVWNGCPISPSRNAKFLLCHARLPLSSSPQVVRGIHPKEFKDGCPIKPVGHDSGADGFSDDRGWESLSERF